MCQVYEGKSNTIFSKVTLCDHLKKKHNLCVEEIFFKQLWNFWLNCVIFHIFFYLGINFGQDQELLQLFKENPQSTSKSI